MRDFVKVTILLGSLALLGASCTTVRAHWQGVFYPQGSTSSAFYSPVFETEDECRAWGDQILRQRDQPSDEYECGKNCRVDSKASQAAGTIVQICEETT